MSQKTDPIVAEFVVESREQMADIENQLLAFEAAGADIDEDLVNTVFRAVHSIKGASGFLGFTILGKLAHKLENVFNLIRNRELVPDSTNVDVMLKAADSICEMIEDIDQSEGYDIESHVAALQLITDAVENPGDGEATGQSPETSEQTPVSAAPQPQSAAPPPAPEPAPEPAPRLRPSVMMPRHQARPRRHKRNSDQLVPRQVPHRRTRTFGSR